MTKIDIYDMGSSHPTRTDAASDDRLHSALNLAEGDVLVLVDETDEAVDFDELDVSQTVGEIAKGRPGLVLLRNPLAKATVDVHYSGTPAKLHVHAATRIRRIRKLAIARLGLTPDDAADTALRLEGSESDLPMKQPIGIYLSNGQREISLDLVHKSRPQG